MCSKRATRKKVNVNILFDCRLFLLSQCAAFDAFIQLLLVTAPTCCSLLPSVMVYAARMRSDSTVVFVTHSCCHQPNVCNLQRSKTPQILYVFCVFYRLTSCCLPSLLFPSLPFAPFRLIAFSALRKLLFCCWLLNKNHI